MGCWDTAGRTFDGEINSQANFTLQFTGLQLNSIFCNTALKKCLIMKSHSLNMLASLIGGITFISDKLCKGFIMSTVTCDVLFVRVRPTWLILSSVARRKFAIYPFLDW